MSEDFLGNENFSAMNPCLPEWNIEAEVPLANQKKPVGLVLKLIIYFAERKKKQCFSEHIGLVLEICLKWTGYCHPGRKCSDDFLCL